MPFTYEWYREFIKELIQAENYVITDYKRWQDLPFDTRCAIIRHDIDIDIKKSEIIAEIESEMGVRSTFFVLLSTDFYNVASGQNIYLLNKLIDMGHNIGLHFDEAKYPDDHGNIEKIVQRICDEAEILGRILGKKIESVSMHRPSREILNSDVEIPGIINSYSKTFFTDFKYLSDSRKKWREPVTDIIRCGEYQRLHINTHAFWYDDKECSLKESVLNHINNGNVSRYLAFKDNITDIDSILSPEEVV